MRSAFTNRAGGFGSLATLAQQGWKGGSKKQTASVSSGKAFLPLGVLLLCLEAAELLLGRDRDGPDSKGWAHGEDADLL